MASDVPALAAALYRDALVRARAMSDARHRRRFRGNG
jgi:hypothetical protein